MTRPLGMRALTLWQPWASLVAVGAKRWETRSWDTKHRGLLAIHAAARAPDRGLLSSPRITDLVGPADQLPRRCVVAVVRVLDTVQVPEPADRWALIRRLFPSHPDPDLEMALGDYAPGRYGWHLNVVHQLPDPVPMRGRQRLWRVPAEIEASGLLEPFDGPLA